MTGPQEYEPLTTHGSEPDTDPESRLAAYLGKIARPSEWPSSLLDSLTSPRTSRWALWTGTGLTMLGSALSVTGIIDQAIRARAPDADSEKRGMRMALICAHSALLVVNMGACSACCALLWSAYTADASRTAGMRRVEEWTQSVTDGSAVELVLLDPDTDPVLQGDQEGDQRGDHGMITKTQLTGNGSTPPMPGHTSTSQ